jgi:uncharacterized membrane protein
MGQQQTPFQAPSAMRYRAFRGAVLHGAALLLPPLLTLVIILWVGRTVENSAWQPATQVARDLLVASLADIHDALADGAATDDPTVLLRGNTHYKRLENGQYVPLSVYQTVLDQTPGDSPPTTGREAYERYIDATYLRPWLAIPVFLCGFLAVTYLLGRFIAAGVGRVFWNVVERGVNRVPVVNIVYSSVKQVTDFMLTESNLQFTRVVALEFPDKGLWQVGFVTGEGMRDIEDAPGDPLVSVLVSTSPLPVTGYTLMVRQSELVDLNITIDEACEYFFSCGVAIPPRKVAASRRPGAS